MALYIAQPVHRTALLRPISPPNLSSLLRRPLVLVSTHPPIKLMQDPSPSSGPVDMTLIMRVYETHVLDSKYMSRAVELYISHPHLSYLAIMFPRPPIPTQHL